MIVKNFVSHSQQFLPILFFFCKIGKEPPTPRVDLHPELQHGAITPDEGPILNGPTAPPDDRKKKKPAEGEREGKK